MAESLILVYGSLLSGERNHGYLQHAQLIGKGITLPHFELLDLGSYPAMVLDGTTAIHGEIYAVDDDTLARLDRLEGHPHYFVRAHITLQGPDELEVWVYVMRREILTAKPRIRSGDWKARRKEIVLYLR